MVFSILLQIPIGLLLTTFLDAGGKKFNAFKTVCFFPYLMSSVAIAFLFNCILTAIGGLFSSLAQLITGKRTTVDLLGKNPQAMFAAIGVMAWQYTPFYMVYFGACFLSAGTHEIQAAQLHLRGHCGHDVHPHARHPHPDLQNDQLDGAV